MLTQIVRLVYLNAHKFEFIPFSWKYVLINTIFVMFINHKIFFRGICWATFPFVLPGWKTEMFLITSPQITP